MNGRLLGYDTIRAVLQGLAVGEAYGLYYSLSGTEPSGELQPLLLGDVAAYGAATQQALLLAESIASSCGFNPSRFARLLAEHADVDNPIRLYSLATAEHVLLLRRGYIWTDARSLVASLEPPLDAIARAAPIPLFYTKERLVAEMAAAQVLTTSLDQRVAVAARTYGLMLYYLLQGMGPGEAVEEAASQTPKQGIRDSLYAALEASTLGQATVRRVVSTPGDPVARLLASAATAPLLAENGAEPPEALRAAITVAPSGSAHLAAAMAGSLLAATGYRLPAPAVLEAEDSVEEAARRLSTAFAECRGLRESPSLTAESS